MTEVAYRGGRCGEGIDEARLRVIREATVCNRVHSMPGANRVPAGDQDVPSDDGSIAERREARRPGDRHACAWCFEGLRPANMVCAAGLEAGAPPAWARL
jgi:hypothetical protein